MLHDRMMAKEIASIGLTEAVVKNAGAVELVEGRDLETDSYFSLGTFPACKLAAGCVMYAAQEVRLASCMCFQANLCAFSNNLYCIITYTLVLCR
jgi:hypothetical protein